MLIRSYAAGDHDQIIALWRRCGLVRPANDPAKDIQRKLRVRPDLLLIGVAEGKIVATAMVGYEGHRGWINYLAVEPALQGQGLGRQIMAEAERRLAAEGCPKINLQIRTSNRQVIAFYETLGYSKDDVVSLGKRLEHDGSPEDEAADQVG